jgi:hypothetical protein
VNSGDDTTVMITAKDNPSIRASQSGKVAQRSALS